MPVDVRHGAVPALVVGSQDIVHRDVVPGQALVNGSVYQPVGCRQGGAEGQVVVEVFLPAVELVDEVPSDVVLADGGVVGLADDVCGEAVCGEAVVVREVGGHVGGILGLVVVEVVDVKAEGCVLTEFVKLVDRGTVGVVPVGIGVGYGDAAGQDQSGAEDG